VGSGKLNGVTSKTILSEDIKREIAERHAGGAGIVELARAYRCRTAQINLIIGTIGKPRQPLTANTPIECRLHDALMAAGIGFTTQKRLVGRYVVDISVHQAPIVIEADGMRHRSGSAAQERDAKRDAAHESAGYRVFRFTGSEINTDAAKCIQHVIDACGLAPDKEPVYDIRTKFSGTDHPRYVGLYELTCGYCGEKFKSKRAKRKYCCHEHYILGAQKGQPKSEHVRAAVAESNRTRVWTPESRAKVSASRTGQPGLKGREISTEQRAKISATLKGRKQSEETRAKKRAAHLGKKRDPEIAAKISAALKGRPKSDAHRANLAASRKRQDQTVIEPDLT
jgi:very-short-patch-repair endonuclease